MCLLIIAPAGTRSLTAEEIYAADYGNPHGIGLSYYDNGCMTTLKLVSVGELVTDWLPILEDTPCLIHFRYATHGARDASNCHPFSHRDWIMAHNGVISCPRLKIPEGFSDTRAFAEEYSRYSFRQLAEHQDELARRIGPGNKLGFFSQDGAEFFIVNEKAGHWRDKVWFSNYSYEALTFGDFHDDGLSEAFLLAEFTDSAGIGYVALEDPITGDVSVIDADEYWESIEPAPKKQPAPKKDRRLALPDWAPRS